MEWVGEEEEEEEEEEEKKKKKKAYLPSGCGKDMFISFIPSSLNYLSCMGLWIDKEERKREWMRRNQMKEDE